ncbi:MAG: YXWGXW repeat-containing protein [Acidobacteriaceae bacterium]|nr:YXWGXW repeat-containing protein [Acidobacteriaceae bacterium]
MKKVFSTALLGIALAVGSANAQVYVRIAPPAPRREVIIERPGPNYVWVGGYHRWEGNGYVWVPGTWVVPPQPYYHRWVPGHWKHTWHGWVWVEGHWRR